MRVVYHFAQNLCFLQSIKCMISHSFGMQNLLGFEDLCFSVVACITCSLDIANVSFEELSEAAENDPEKVYRDE